MEMPSFEYEKMSISMYKKWWWVKNDSRDEPRREVNENEQSSWQNVQVSEDFREKKNALAKVDALFIAITKIKRTYRNGHLVVRIWVLCDSTKENKRVCVEKIQIQRRGGSFK